MSRPKKSKPRGRPPKYVLDDKGKEIVGLSYNDSNNMYYATGSNPRHYFHIPFQINKKEEAIRQFCEWKKSTGYTTDDIEQQKYRNEVHQKAVSLIGDGYFEELIGKKANSIVEEWVTGGQLDKYVLERAYDLINESPDKAAKTLGIKNIVAVNANYQLPLRFHQVWKIFCCYKNKESYLFDPKAYDAVFRKINYILGNQFLYKIVYADFQDAVVSYPIKPRKAIEEVLGRQEAVKFEEKMIKYIMGLHINTSLMDSLDILKDIFTTAKNAGYNQAEHILKMIIELSNKH